MFDRKKALLWPIALLSLASGIDAKPCSRHGKHHTATAPPAAGPTVDVAIIGGGASGTYAAIRLAQDYNLNVAVIEQQGRLVGYLYAEASLYLRFSR
ncbi:hypothetical protein BX600DRAFT_473490 [Xylariales sp. PMI_506]|nr:hypothetical protein BX600DRAFT_473490 [Xylariales sp. PMI_506]